METSGFWSHPPVRTTMPLTPTWAETLGLHSTNVCWLKCPLPSVLVWGKRRYIGHAELLTPEKQRQTVLIVLSAGIFDILKLQLMLLGKFPLLSSVSWRRREKENSFWFYFSPTAWEALMANAFFIPPEYWPLHPILVSVLRFRLSQTWLLNEHKTRLQDHPVPEMNTAFWGDLQVLCSIRTITHLLYTWSKHSINTIRIVMQQIVFYKYSAWVQVVF